MNKAIVVGSINMDIVAFVDRHPKVGETIFGKDVKYFPGGKGSNQAVAAKRLGCETAMIGRLGDDAFGAQMLEFQKNEGIDVRGVIQVANTATGTAFITVSESSDNSIIVISGANSIWDDSYLDNLDSIDMRKGDVLLAQFEVPNIVIEKTFRKAKSVGATTILNPAPVRPVDRAIANCTDIIVINEHELQELSGVLVNQEDDDSVFNGASTLIGDGYNSIIVTLGDRGVRLLHDGQRKRMNARSVTAVDTTGAGDTFIGGLTAGILSGMALSEAAEFGNIAASISVTREGAASSIPTVAEVNQIFGHSNGN